MYSKSPGQSIHQGDLIENFKYNYPPIQGEEIEFDSIILPYVVVVSQDCDLEWDFENRNNPQENVTNDKFLLSILISPAHLAESFKIGVHLQSLGLTMNTWPSDLWKRIKQNQDERFHFLPANTDFEIPDLVIDFKQYYTIPTEKIYEVHKSNYLASIEPLFREDLSQRFANYLSRIGLPNKAPQGELVSK